MSSLLYARALAAYQAGAWANAERFCREILAQNASDVEALQLLGATLRARGDLGGAETVLRSASALAPGDAKVLSSLANVFLAQGDYENARDVLSAALKINPRLPWALQAMGNLLLTLGELKPARAIFDRALAEAPDHPHILTSLAVLADKERRYDDSERLAKQALAAAPRHGGAHLALAQARFQRGAYSQLIEDLAPTLEMMPPLQRVHALGLLARGHEKLNHYGNAHAAFTAANKIRADLDASRYLNMPSSSSLPSVARLTAFMRRADPQSWSAAPEAERSPVILTGFPRSGTTLVEQALASHPDIEALEERETIEEAFGPLVLDDKTFERWPDLTPDDIASFRAAYWRCVAQYQGWPLKRAVFVDKQPLALVQLPLIYRIFPRAKILFVLRDPRDVVLSCFQQNFQLNPALVNFLTLEGAARYYDAAMTLAQLSRARLPLDLHVVRYEDVVNDFRGTMQQALAFLGLPWNESVMRYAETAEARVIRTPSAGQVRQPVYNTALGRWRRYEEQLRPVLPVLAPWVSAYGFPPA